MYEQHIVPLSLAALVFLGGAALVILFYRLDIKDSAAIIALIIAPLLVYGIAAGKILELSGPGGWSAKFQEAAEQKVTTTATAIAYEMKDIQPVDKQGLDKLHEILPKLQKGKPVALILNFGRQDYYQSAIVQTYAEKLSEFDPETIVILVDNETKHFVGTIDVGSFLTLLRYNAQGIIDAISTANLGYLARFPKFVFRGIRSNQTNARALKEMQNLDVNRLVVLNEQDKPVAIVRRDEIVTHIVEKLLG